MADVVYRISNGAMRFVLRAFSRWTVEGLENLNQTGFGFTFFFGQSYKLKILSILGHL